MDDVLPLGRKKDQDGVQQPDERPWGNPLDEALLVPLMIDRAKREPSGDGCAQRDPEKHTDAARDDGIRDMLALPMADDVDEEDGQRCVQDHLQDRVHGDQYGTIFLIATGKTGPDQNLESSVSLGSAPVIEVTNHGYTACKPDKYQPISQSGLIW